MWLTEPEGPLSVLRCCQYPPERVELTVIKTAEPVNIRGILQSKGQVVRLKNSASCGRAVASDQVALRDKKLKLCTREVESGGGSSQAVRKAGIGAYLLAQHATAERLLSGATSDGVAMYVLGMVYLSMEKWKDAEAKFAAAAKAGYDNVEIAS